MTVPTQTVRDLRAVLGRFATGVTVITAALPDGTPTGMTANSFTSVSLDPALVLFCVNRDSLMHEVFAQADAFAVNVLRERDAGLARAFARPGRERFDGLTARRGASGAPLLPDPLAVVECRDVRHVPMGDHDIVVGAVMAIERSAGHDSAPLLYFDGAFAGLHDPLGDWAAQVL